NVRAQGAGAGAGGVRGRPAHLARRHPGAERSAQPMKTREDAQITSLAAHRGDFFRVLQETARSQVAVMTIAPGADGGPEEEHGGDQIVYVVEGEALLRVGGTEHHVG